MIQMHYRFGTASAYPTKKSACGLTLTFAASLIALLGTGPAHALNGLNVIGFGADSGAMGGADVALARDTSVLNANPAGLVGIERRADAYFSAAYALGIGHADSFGNDLDISNRLTLLGGGGYAWRVGQSNVHLGIGLFAQGGAGGVYRNLQTAFGTRDELSSLFSIGRVVPGIAWRVSPELSLGASLAINRVEGRSRVFPDTSVVTPAGAFFGYEFRGLTDVKPTVKLGAQYRPSDRTTLGLVYTTRTDFHLTGSQMTVDFSALGLGKVPYRNARFDGFGLPAQLEAGAAWQLTPRTLLSAEVGRLQWSQSMQRATLTASDPSSPLAPATLTVTSTLDWKDQTVIALGVEQRVTDRLRLRAGFNYGRSPVPPRTMQPVLAAIHERHLTGGFAYDIDTDWSLSGSFELQPGNRVRYTNAEIPFGVDTLARNRYMGLTIMASYRWN